MYKHKMSPYTPEQRLWVNESVEGESIENKIERMINNREPMSEPGVGLLFTAREDGVLAETDIRTDRFEIAVEAADKIQKSHIAKREERIKNRSEEKKGDDGEAKSIQGTDNTGT